MDKVKKEVFDNLQELGKDEKDLDTCFRQKGEEEADSKLSTIISDKKAELD